MRDLMVVKSTGAESEFLILTAEQKKRTAELAEKFDAAALIYSITALERLRWALKNSDTPRALLEASLLRFALSEHFMNVDELMSQLKGSSSTSIKKNKVIEKAKPKVPESTFVPSPVRNFPTETANTMQIEKISNGASEPRETREEGQGEFETADNELRKAEPAVKQTKISSQRKNEIINDPAVKTVLIGLDAMITGIEED